MRAWISAAAGMAVLFLSINSTASLAHEGHDHGEPAAVARPEAAPRGAAASSEFELVAVAQGAELVIYLDRFASNEPVEGATVEVETPDGSTKATATNGTYRIKAPWLAKPGPLDLIVSVTADGKADVLPVSITIPDHAAATDGAGFMARMTAPFRHSTLLSAGAGIGLGLAVGVALMSIRRRPIRPAAALLLAVAWVTASAPGLAQDQRHPALDAGTDRAMRDTSGAVFVPKSIQRIFGLRTLVSEIATHPLSIEMPGRIIPDPNAIGYVQASVGGRLSAPPGGFPRLGAPVREGDVLAQVTPPMQAIDVSDMRQRQGELDQQIDIVERRLARYERLAPSGAVALAQLEETRYELKGLKDRRGALDTARRNTEALLAPVSGVIADGAPVAGQITQPNSIVFQIVDPARLWVEALSFDAIAGSPSASATTAKEQTLRLAFRGSGLADRNQSIPVHFAIEGEINGLRAGQFVTVFVRTGEDKRGIAIPRASLARSANGQDLVYVHVAAERFEPRAVRVEPLDGERVLVSAGIEVGQRIVVQGAELLDHVR